MARGLYFNKAIKKPVDRAVTKVTPVIMLKMQIILRPCELPIILSSLTW